MGAHLCLEECIDIIEYVSLYVCLYITGASVCVLVCICE